MVDLGEGARDVEFDLHCPVGFRSTVVRAKAAALMMSLSRWPRMVALFEGADLLPVAGVAQEACDPVGTVLVTLGEHAGMRGLWWGDRQLAVLGALPLPDDDVWWTWLRGVRLYGRHEHLMLAANNAGLPEPTRMAPPSLLMPASARRREESPPRRVLLLGGPQDGDEIETDCLELEMPGVLVGTVWHRPGDVDPELAAVMVRHVFYRVRRVAELDRTGPWWDGERLEGWEWVATFEGERPLEGGWPEGWLDIGTTTDPREHLLSVVAAALRDRCAKEGIALPEPTDHELARAVLDALEDVPAEHVQRGGDADPDDVLVAIVDGMDTTGYPGPLDATSRCGGLVESALDVQRVLLERFVLRPRP